MNNCELLVPTYLRFLRGVVDSADLPLNVSREMLQSNAQAERIKGSLTRKILDELRRMRDGEYDKYVEFHRQLGRVLKEGVHVDAARKEDVASLLLFESTTTDAGTYTMLEQYVDRMKPDQEDVYYIVAASRAEAEGSPYLESFRARDIEVLILTDEIDDIIMGSLGQFKGKQMKSVTRGSVDLDKDEARKTEEAAKQHAGLIDLIKDRLKDKVKDVRFSGGRLKDSLCCLVGDEGAMDHQLEQLMKAMGQEVPADKRILEINPNHPVVAAMQGMFESDPGSVVLGDYVQLLYDQAVLFMGMRPEDPTGFAARVARLMAGAHGKG
jgi:molecular chaperone HtpG